jgi:hypothetical protein
MPRRQSRRPGQPGQPGQPRIPSVDSVTSAHAQESDGIEGKLRKVMELVSMPWDEAARPLNTVLELKDLRDTIAHAKPEIFSDSITVEGTEVPMPLAVPALNKIVTPDARAIAVADIEQFLDQIQGLAKPQIRNDPWFGDRALRGPAYYVAHSSP